MFENIVLKNCFRLSVQDYNHQTASATEIRRAYRKLSLQLHPDKNKAPDAEKKFLEMVSVYEVLKDPEKRQRYNDVLKNGLPDWKQPVFYYRRVRKMGFLELSVLMFLILTVGQYLVIWSVYLERKFTVEENYASKLKKSEKKSRKKAAMCENEIEAEFKEELNAINRPQLIDLWPLRLTCWLYTNTLNIPLYYCLLRQYLISWRERCKEVEVEEENPPVQEPVKKVKKRQRIELPEYSAETFASTAAVAYTPSIDITLDSKPEQKIKSGVEWNEEDYALLARAIARYPGGTTGRWEKVAEMVARPVSEVISKSKSNKKNILANSISGLQDSVNVKPTTKSNFVDDNIISTKMNSEVFLDTMYGSQTPIGEKGLSSNQKKKSNIKTVAQNIGSIETVESEKAQTNSVPSESLSTTDRSNSSSHSSHIKITDEISRDSQDFWSQANQMTFEKMLRLYPKGTELRWEKIAENIPSKSKEDCILRFKYLVSMIKKKKVQQ
ncbi:dnaJ homolog subfamily C member 1 [Octopus bimaculoides]|nr:dnaJ homolog subfamily C member 1 [Octopus bimaculoides]